MTTIARPFAVDPSEYPFEDHWLPLRDGYVHYVDEGAGPVVLLLHGNPTWSYIYRNVIKELRGECRVIAPDYPGFGMSKAPSGYKFKPAEHSEVVGELVSRLGLKNIVVVVYDWGGPIGINYAVHNRANLRGLVVMNTFAWKATFMQNIFSIVMGGWPLGYWLQTQKNYFAASMLPDGIFLKDKADATFRKAFTDPFPTPESRKPTWIFPREIRGSHKWLADMESKLGNLADVPAQILWGKYDDPGFPESEMKRWQGYLKLHETETLEDAGHSVQEDRPDRVAAAVRRLLQRTAG